MNQLQSYINVKANIDFSKRLPNYVFKENWGVFLFFTADHRVITDVVDNLKQAEGSPGLCLLQFSSVNDFGLNKEISHYFSNSIDPKQSHTLIRAKSVTPGIDIYGAMSEVGEWCIYMECMEDTGVLALRDLNFLPRYKPVIEKICAGNLFQLMKPGPIGWFPFNQYVKRWKLALLKNYNQDYIFNHRHSG